MKRFLVPIAALTLGIRAALAAAPAPVPMAMQAAPAAASGWIQGYVLEASGRPLAGARVSAAGQTVSTDTQGLFQLTVPAGEHTLEITAEGYEPTSQAGIAVAAGQAANQTMRLTPQLEAAPPAADAGQDVRELQGVEVTGQQQEQAGGQLEAAIERRESAQVAEVLSIEQIARGGDSDTGAALKRVTGLTLVDNRYIYVRGLGERYSSVVLNGAQIPSPDPTRRVIPLDLFPTDIIESIAVQKTYSAEMPGEFGGGTVQLRTKKYPNEAFFKLGGKLGYVQDTTGEDGLSYRGGGDDWTGYDDGTRALPDSLAEATADGQFLRRQSVLNPDGATPQELEIYGEDLAAAGYNTFAKSIDPDYGLSASGGNRFEVGDEGVFGFVAGTRYDRSFELRDDETRRSFSASDAGLVQEDSLDVTQNIENVDVSGFLNLGFDWGEAHSLGFTSIYLHQAEDRATLQQGERVNEQVQLFELQWLENELFSNQLEGRHLLGLGDLALNWFYNDARATREEPNTRRYRRDDDNEDGVYTFSTRADSNSQTFGELRDDASNWQAALELPLSWGEDTTLTLQGGFNRVDRDRESEQRTFSFSPSVGFLRNNPDLIFQDMDTIFAPENIGPGQFELRETTTATDNYTAEQRLDAAFLSADLKLGEAWRITAGAREEDNFQQVVTSDLTNPNAPPVVAEIDQSDVLPALAVTWRFLEDQQLRLGYGESLSRPDFRELSPAPYRDPILDINTVGNPDLVTTNIKNYDLRWEKYFSPTEVLSVALFYKDFENPIEKTFTTGGSSQIITLQNALSAEAYGIELDAFKYLDFVIDWGWVQGSFLENLDWTSYYVGFNYTRVESDVEIDPSQGSSQTNANRPLQGQSPYATNFQVGYVDPEDRREWTLLYNVFGERIAQAGVAGQPDIYEQPFNQLDFTFRQKLGDAWTLRLRLMNLLDDKVEFTQGDGVTREYRKGRELQLAFEWKPF